MSSSTVLSTYTRAFQHRHPWRHVGISLPRGSLQIPPAWRATGFPGSLRCAAPSHSYGYDLYERRPERYDYRDPYERGPPGPPGPPAYDPYDPYARHYQPPPGPGPGAYGGGAYVGGYYPPPPGYGYGQPPPHYPPPAYPPPGPGPL